MFIAAPPRIEPAFNGPEKTQLEAWLDYHRATLLMKCEGLNSDNSPPLRCPPRRSRCLGYCAT